MKCAPTHTPEIDLPALRDKYRHERDKRIRPEGGNQYVETAEDFAQYYEADPYSPPIVRAAVCEDIDAAVLGGGFAGLISAARIRQAGVSSLSVIDLAGDFGGAWYWNRYPGIQCDTDSCCYLPMLEEVNYIPKDKYAYGAEVYEHCRRIGRHFGLYETALFGTLVRSLRWDESIDRWRIGTNRGDDIRARFVVMCPGPFNRPKLPGIAGIESFKGHTFHTARWDYQYTGGDMNGGLYKLGDKRVAIIGTGASAIQCIPFLARSARHLYVFQRTPSYIDDRGNRRVDAQAIRAQGPGWQRARQANFHTAAFVGFSPGEPDLICDGWTEVSRNLAAKMEAMGWPALSTERLLELREIEDYKAMERLRRRIDEVVRDRATAGALKPYYRFLCKRPCFSDEYLPAFNRPNVTLIDVSSSKGVERITGTGVVAHGVEYPVDCIIFASGFEITTGLRRRFGIDPLIGRGGLSLYDHWAGGYRTLHGMMSHGFPNLFFTGFFQGGVSANTTAMFEQQGRHIAYIIGQTLARGAATVEPTAQAQDKWVRIIRETSITDRQFWRECTPGYYNNEGEELFRSHLGEPYGPGFYAFEDLLQQWRGQGGMEGLVLGK